MLLRLLLTVATLAPFTFGEPFGEEGAFIHDTAYATGKLGTYPISTYLTTDIVAPRVNKLSTDERCTKDLYTFFSPRGSSVSHAGPYILDDDGYLIWSKDMTGLGQTYGFAVQQYKNQSVLTYWVGNDGVKGHGAGDYFILDQSYKEIFKVSAAGGKDADLHEMAITPEGTALITVYDIIPFDLTPLGRTKDGFIWDGIIQEINIETGELVFEWRASDHVKLTDSYRGIGGDGESYNRAFDYFHMNSIEKDPLGNYLVSTRYYHTLIYIDGRTKEILWELGGKNNAFKDLSDGQATNFAWQHHGRWHDNYTSITVFDNGAQQGQITSPYSRGVHVRLDLNSDPKTAELIQEYIPTDKISVESQGSNQILDNGNVLLGFGHSPLIAEFAPDGTPLCETYFGSQARLGAGDVESYRTLKYKWIGRPLEPPIVKLLEEELGGGMVVSWMGATEVKYWSVESSPEAEGDEYAEISRTPKVGFETRLELGKVVGYIRVVGLDKNGRILGWSEIIDLTVETTWETDKLRLVDEGSVPFVLLISFLAFVGTLLIAWEVVQWRLRVRKSHSEEKAGDTEEAERFIDQNSSQGSPSPDTRQPIPKIHVERNWDEFNPS